MGRRKKKIIKEEEDYKDWPFQISIKLTRFKPKVAFLSGCERGYYPEDPGYSRFALAYCLPDPDDTAKCNFVPSSNLLPKPVSTLGYGIGGLLGPRFAKEAGIDNPAPNEYQKNLVPERVKEREKKKKIKWNDFVQQYERIVEQQYAKWDAEQTIIDGMVRKGMRNSADMGTGQLYHPKKLSQEKRESQLGHAAPEPNLIQAVCNKKSSAFGTSLTRPRFEKDDLNPTAGVGTYNWSEYSNIIPKPVSRVRTNCLPDSCDTCMNCGLELRESDYYQTKVKYKVINKVDPMTHGKYKHSYLSFCRRCYCYALKNGYEPWSKERIPMLFLKARHCHAIHDHKEGHNEFLTKATCKAVNYLSRKEVMYHRFFKDTPCQKT